MVLSLAAVNRNRRAVGERLYEIASLFREIGMTFERCQPQDNSAFHLRQALEQMQCKHCHNFQRCVERGMRTSLDRLIAVGRLKGKVNLMDLPGELSSACVDCGGLLYAINQTLEEYKRCAEELENARIGRKLLAEQALGVSEILRDLALEQSEELHYAEEETAFRMRLPSVGFYVPNSFYTAKTAVLP